MKYKIGELVRFKDDDGSNRRNGWSGLVAEVSGYWNNDTTCLFLKGMVNHNTCGWFTEGRFEPANEILNTPVEDAVDQPKHYSRWKMQPIEFIAINDLPGWLANVIKYVMRYDAKDGLKDLYKARSYLDMQIRKLEGVERFWEKPVAEERRLNALPR